MNTNINTNVDFGTNNTNTNTSNTIGSTPNNNQSTYQNTSPSNNNVQTESMDLSFATEQVANESKSILESIGDFFSDLGEGLKETGATIANGAKTVANWAINGLKDLGSNIKEACTNLASNVTSILGSALSWAADTYIDLQSTAAVIGTTVVSGIADIGEGIVDGLAWTGGKLVEGGSWLVGKVAGWFSDDAEEAVMNWRDQAKTDVKEFIGHDWVGEANDWFYQETSLGQFINENSYLKYDSEAMQKLRGASEMVGKLVLATAATVVTGGAAAPIALGFLFGTGEQAEKLYQENPNTTGAQELGIFVSGLGEALNWYAQGQLGKGGLSVAKMIGENGIKNTGAIAIEGIKSLLSNVKSNGFINTIKGILKSSNLASLQATDNLIDSLGIIADNTSDWLVGNEKFNLKTAASAGGELISAWLLNMFFDGAGEYLGKMGKQGDNILQDAGIFSGDDTASLGSKFDEFTTGKTGSYGVDQAACRRMTYVERLNNDWLTDVEDFRKFLKEKYPDWPDSEIDDALKIFTESERLSEVGKKDVIDYLQKNSTDYQSALEAFNNSFKAGKSPDYDRILNKYIQAGLSEADAIHLLSSIDTVGVCSYAAVANNIASTFMDNPQLFKETFGYDLFTIVEGKQVLNSAELLSDLYVYANLDTNGGKLFTMVDGKLTYLSKDFSLQTYLSGSMYTRDDLIDGFLKSKSPDLGYTDNIKVVSNYDRGILLGMTDSTKYTVEDVKKVFDEVLVDGNSVQLGIYRTPNNKFTFYNMDGSVHITTNSWNEGSGHAVFVTGMTDDGIIVSSWGEKLLIKYEDFINNRYNIAWGQITGVTPSTVSNGISPTGTTKVITDGVGDGQSNLTAEFRSDKYRRYSTYEEFTQSMAENRATQEILDIASKERLSTNLENYKGNDIRYPGNYIGVNGYLRGDTFITNGKPDTSKDFLVEQVIMHCSGGSKPPMTAKQFKKMYGSATNCYKYQKDTAEFLSEVIRECPLGENTQFIRGVNWKALEEYGISETDTVEMIKEKLISFGTYRDKGFSSVCPLLDSDELPAILTGKPIKLVLNVDGSTGAFDLSTINSKEMEVLLQNGLEFNTVDVKNIEGDIYIYMEQAT